MRIQMAADRLLHGPRPVTVEHVSAGLTAPEQRIDEGVEVRERWLDPLAPQIQDHIVCARRRGGRLAARRDRNLHDLLRLLRSRLRAPRLPQIGARHRELHGTELDANRARGGELEYFAIE